jgi:hypothetical protein
MPSANEINPDLMEGNTHISDLKEITINIFGANKAEGPMEEYGMQNACIFIFSISISRRYVVYRTHRNTPISYY